MLEGHGIKPIIGNEMYVINGRSMTRSKKRRSRYHLVVLAKNATLATAIWSSSRASAIYVACVAAASFRAPASISTCCKQYSEGLIVATACLGGEIPQAILRGRMDVAREVASWYRDLFGDDFYLEIQDHGSPEDRIVNTEIVRLSPSELGIQLIATNDAHYLSREDVEAHDALLCVLTGKLLSDEKRFAYTGTEYIKSEEEMGRLFADHLPAEVVQRSDRQHREGCRESRGLRHPWSLSDAALSQFRKAIPRCRISRSHRAGLSQRLELEAERLSMRSMASA